MKTLPYIERGIRQSHNIPIEFRPEGAAPDSCFSALHRPRGDEWCILNSAGGDWTEEMALPPDT